MSAADKIAAARALIEPLTGHTPGPWHYGMSDIYADGSDGDNIVLAAVGVSYGLRSSTYSRLRSKDPRVLASANLMAAAPALRDTVAALADLADAQAQEIARLRGGRIDWEWLDAEITAIPTRYHGDPSHDHDAYWFKTEVLDLIRKAAGWDTDACAALGSEQDDPLMRTTFHVQV